MGKFGDFTRLHPLSAFPVLLLPLPPNSPYAPLIYWLRITNEDGRTMICTGPQLYHFMMMAMIGLQPGLFTEESWIDSHHSFFLYLIKSKSRCFSLHHPFHEAGVTKSPVCLRDPCQRRC